MGKKKRNNRIDEQLEANFDVDLTPVLSLMVCLIPIMLLSTVFVRVTVIETPLPQVVAQALEEDRSKKDRDVSVKVNMDSERGLQLIVQKGEAVLLKKDFPKQGTDWNLGGLRSELVKVKLTHPKVFRLDLSPSENVPYDDIVKLMDEVRKTKQGDSKLFVEDQATSQKIETDLMFPDVYFANVVEG